MEIYLTKMSLNPRNREVRRLLDYRNCQNLHIFVMQGFPHVEGEKTEVRKKFGVLHRLETDARLGKITLLIQSAFKPVWNLAEDFLLENEFAQKEVGRIYSFLKNDIELMFRLRANPTKRVGKNYQHPDEKTREEFDRKFKARKQRRRIGIYSEKEQIEWLRKKGEQHGFQLLTVKVNPDESVVSDVLTASENKVFGKSENKNNKEVKDTLTFNTVVFNGNLIITDAEKFRETLIHGIGQGKAYGYGLLSIAKSLNL